MTVFFLALAALAGAVVGFGGGYWLRGRIDSRRNQKQVATELAALLNLYWDWYRESGVTVTDEERELLQRHELATWIPRLRDRTLRRQISAIDQDLRFLAIWREDKTERHEQARLEMIAKIEPELTAVKLRLAHYFH